MTIGSRVEFERVYIKNEQDKFDPNELLDIVDESENVLYQVGFKEAHEKSLLHRFCRVLLIEESGNILLQKRSSAIPDAGKFDTARGHLNVGEMYEEAAQREIKEEMGVDISASDLILLGDIEDRKRPKIENMLGKAYFSYVCPPYVLEGEEVESLISISTEDLKNAILRIPESFSPKLLQTFNLWLSYNKSHHLLKGS